MKRFLTLVIIQMWVLNTLSSQSTITNASFPTAGDTLRTANIAPWFFDGFSVGEPGPNQVWDYNALNTGYQNVALCLDASDGTAATDFPSATHVLVSDFEETYLKITNDKVSILGLLADNFIFGGKIVVKYAKSPNIIVAPLSYGNTVSNITQFNLDFGSEIIPDSLLAAFPIKPDSLRLQFSVTSSGSVDAWGVLKTQGESLDVIREKTFNYLDTKIFAKLGFIGWLDVTSLIGASVPDEFEGLIGKDTTTSYNFYGEGFKVPVLVAEYSRFGTVNSIEMIDLGGILSSTSDAPKLAAITLYPNPTLSDIHIRASEDMNGDYQFSVYSMSGALILSQRAILIPNDVVTIPLPAIPAGPYIIRVSNDSNKTVGIAKFLKGR